MQSALCGEIHKWLQIKILAHILIILFLNYK